MSFVADLRDAIHGFHFADRRLSQLSTPQAAQVTVADDASKAETALSESGYNVSTQYFYNSLICTQKNMQKQKHPEIDIVFQYA